MRKVLVVSTCAALLLVFAVPANTALTLSHTYGYATYGPGGQTGGLYDCPQGSRTWLRNTFFKDAARVGKSIFIDGNGNWVAAAEDATTATVLHQGGLGYKKGSVRNTSSYTYVGEGATYYESNVFCL